LKEKELGKDDFTKIPNGGPGIEHRLSLVYTGGVHGGRFSPNRFVQLVSTAPAKLFGLFPRKGTIAVGSDADLVVFDPNEEQVISVKTHHMRVDYSMFEGTRIKGVPRTVLSRGRPVIEEGKFVGRAGSGEFIRRQPYGGI
jgi:dihydropyrimidinase